MISRHPLREGLVAGVLGATSIVVWGLAVDALNDRAGVTFALLGAWIYEALGGSPGGRSFATHVATWVITVYVVVIAVSIVTSYMYNKAEQKPSIILGLIAVVAVLELGLISATALASQTSTFGSWVWLHGLIGNAIGAFAIGRYLWRRHHPEAAWDWEQANEAHFHAGPGHAPGHAPGHTRSHGGRTTPNAR
jgi:hypothetical protein